LLDKIEKRFGHLDIFIRIGMINPIIPKRIIDLTEIVEKSHIFYKFLHIPIQSASDHILTLMKRGYTSKDLRHIFQNFQNSQITVSTDVICGFPDESEEDFQMTYDFLKEFKPDIVNISKFTARPNTEAKKMKQLDSHIIKQRTLALSKLYSQYMVKKNIQWKGWKGRAIVHGYQPKKRFPYTCRNEFYKPVVLKKGKLNTVVSVQITDSNGQFLIGTIIDK
jgi:tRNA A37 methylthiotransferase MiaB